MKRICDYPDDANFTGFKVKGMKTGKIGVVQPQPLEVGVLPDPFWEVCFEGDVGPHYNGWFWNDCEVEVVEEGPEYKASIEKNVTS